MSNIRKIQSGKLSCNCIISETSSVAYILTPMPMDEPKLAALAERYATSIIAIEGMDWDHDLTPWPSPAVMKGDADFKGLASSFLLKVLETVHYVESLFKIEDAERTLIGISLSGLFAMWAWTQTDMFTHVGTLSGSYWYEGLVEWFAAQTKPTTGCIYMAVGDKEHESRNKHFASIEENTDLVAEILRQNGNKIISERVPGTHYASVWPRLEGLFKGLNQLKQITNRQ